LEEGWELIRQLLFKTNDSNNSSLTLFFYEKDKVFLRISADILELTLK